MKKKTKGLPSIKKDIKGFLLSEEGKINKKTMLKIGLSLVMLKMMFEPEAAQAGTTHSNHCSSHTSGWDGTAGHLANCVHANHAVHSPHSEGSWC